MSTRLILFNLTSKLGLVTIGKLLTIISLPIITRALGTENYGIYTLAIAIAGYAFLPANWGFLAKGIRDVAKAPEKSITTLENLVAARVILWLVGVLGALVYTFFFVENLTLSSAIIIALGINLWTAIIPDFYYYGLKKTTLPSLAAFIGQLFFVLLVFSLNKFDLIDLKTVLYLHIVAKIIEALMLYVPIFKNLNFRFKDFYISKSLRFLKDNFLLGLGAKAGFIFSTFPIIILSYYSDPHSLGLFSASFKLFLVVSMLYQSMNLVFSPWVVESKIKERLSRINTFRKLILLYVSSGILLGLTLFFMSEFITNILFGNEFIEANKMLKMISMLLIPIWSIYVLLVMYLNNFELDKVFFYGTIILIILLFILLPLGIIYYQVNGLIIGLFVSLFFTIFYYLVKIKKSFLHEKI